MVQETGDVLSQTRHGKDLGTYFDPFVVMGDRMGTALATNGDLNGDGVVDVVVGVPGKSSKGEVWTVYLAADGSIISHSVIGEGQGGFSDTLGVSAEFGHGIAFISDLDGDGVDEIAVGAPNEGISGDLLGAIWILFMNADQTVRSEVKISEGLGGFGGDLDVSDRFGESIACLGDLNGDGVDDIAVGAPGNDDGGSGKGAVWILALTPSGTVCSERKISETSTAGFVGPLQNNGAFGRAVTGLGDFDGDGVVDLAVGAPGFTGSSIAGEVWGLLLFPDGAIKSQAQICADFSLCSSAGGFAGNFGWSIQTIGDLDGNGVTDLVVGEPNATLSNSSNIGSIWTILLEADGSVKYANQFAEPNGGYNGLILSRQNFGASLASLGDRDGNGIVDLVVGSAGDDADIFTCQLGLCEYGALYLLNLEGGFAGQVIRNGSGVNASCFVATSPPALGSDWTSEVDASAHAGAGMTFVAAYSASLPGVPSTFGELLVDPLSDLLSLTFANSGGATGFHSIAIPFDDALFGFTAFAQGGILGGAGPELCNAIDLVLGI